ncbi:protein kinase, ATP binding site-containing protein [Tanacetum coccineum]
MLNPNSYIEILCELERIYPPAFFDIMIHLPIHLALEALEGGPISDDEDPLPHDLADSDVEDLINDDDGVEKVYSSEEED